MLLTMLLNKRFVMWLGLLFASTSAIAHPGHEQLSLTAGLLSGFIHPIMGLDHLIVLFSLGYMSHSLLDSQRWILPLTFVGLMAVGFVVAHSGIHIVSAATTELMISVSLILAAVLLAVNSLARKFLKSFSGLFSAGLLTMFAIFHGFAHGYEVPQEASVVTFGLAFSAMSLVIAFTASFLAGRVVTVKTLVN